MISAIRAFFARPAVRRLSATARRMATHPIAIVIFANVVIVIFAMTQIAFVVVDHWSQRDIELRSNLVYRSIHENVVRGLRLDSPNQLGPYFQQLAEDQRAFALGYCDADGKLLYATKAMPASVKCPDPTKTTAESYSRAYDNGRPLSVAQFPVPEKEGGGQLLVLQDLTFIVRRAHEAELYMALALVVIAIALGLLAAVVVFVLMRGWTDSFRSALSSLSRNTEGPRPPAPPLSRDIETLMAELRMERRYARVIHVEWSPETLRQLLVEELPGAQVMVVSNREPYIHNMVDGKSELQTPASGLVSALEPVMRACGGVWIAHGSGSADRDTVDRNDRVAVPPDHPAYSLRRVWLSDEEQDGYYYGFANEGLWPLCHIAFVRPIFRESDFAFYNQVNQRFADAVVQEASRDDPIVLVQDYHFGLLPRMIRERLPRATIITFWHIPWPNAETFSICPWREEIIDGLLGSSILGFHTNFHCNNFLEGVDRFLEARIDREHTSVTRAGHETLVRAYPISIEWPPAALGNQAPIAECRAAVTERFRLPEGARIAVGIERFDYTKGIVDRMHAVETLLERKPEWRGKFVFLQAAAPTRAKLESYSSLQTEAIRVAQAINERFGSEGYKPIVLSVRHHEPHEVFEMFRAADICVVSSLHDGMNLVAKEFVAARDDEQGVLLLSSFAGASRELAEALIVNPYDAHRMSEALDAALRMPEDAQRARMRAMRDQVRQRNVHLWAAQMLIDAARLRRREAVAAA